MVVEKGITSAEIQKEYLLIKELEDGYLKENGEFIIPEIYLIDEKDAKTFDLKFIKDRVLL